jgi:hypothetical protein
MNQGFIKLIAALLGLCALIAASAVYAAGTTQRERTMSRYKNCEWTEAMSKQIYECVVRNNGFGTHWCFDETVQLNCEPEPLETADKDSGVSQK